MKSIAYVVIVAILAQVNAQWESESNLELWLSISAQRRLVEVSWNNAPHNSDDIILLTNQEPYTFEKLNIDSDNLAPGVNPSELTHSSNSKRDLGVLPLDIDANPKPIHTHEWNANNGAIDILAQIKPTESKQWYTTMIPFDFELSKNVTKHTRCYGFWASYLNINGTILLKECLKAQPTWMNDMRSIIGDFRLRDLFIPGTHDSGSYIPNFVPNRLETIVTKYALTQDDDIRSQLYHGARYLDIRVGYYKNFNDKFYVNHGITRQRPLIEVVNQVKDFVLDTNEIVIFGIKEFPVGFGKKLDIHRLLVGFLQRHFDELIVDPELSWHARINDIWRRKQNIIIAYDKPSLIPEFPTVLFQSVDQRWGNVRNWSKLERHLRTVGIFDQYRLSSRPVADMAELTPDTWGVISDKYGGLRKMADEINWRVSQLYEEELAANANIVAVDFMRGTNIVDLALKWNRKKVI